MTKQKQNQDNVRPIIIKNVNIAPEPSQEATTPLSAASPKDHLKAACGQVAQAATKIAKHFINKEREQSDTARTVIDTVSNATTHAQHYAHEKAIDIAHSVENNAERTQEMIDQYPSSNEKKTLIAEDRHDAKSAQEQVQQKGNEAVEFAKKEAVQSQQTLAEAAQRTQKFAHEKAVQAYNYAQKKGKDAQDATQNKAHEAKEYLEETAPHTFGPDSSKGAETGHTLKTAITTSAAFVKEKLVTAVDKTRQFIHEKTAPHKPPYDDET